MTNEPETDVPRRRRWRPRPIRLTRDGLLFGLGVIIILHELLIQSEVRPEFLLLATTLVGSVPYLRRGDSERDKRSGDGGTGP